MENKINIAELIKDCPRGMELDCVMFENPVTLEKVNIECKYPITIKTIKGDIMVLTKYGQYAYVDDAKCIIFPKGKTTWEKFTPTCKFKDGDIVSTTIFPKCTWVGIFKKCENKETFESYCSVNAIGKFHDTCLDRHPLEITNLATEEEKAELFKAIKENGYRWNAETKTLERLPKFKDGDIVYTTLNSIVIIEGKCKSEPYYTTHCGITDNYDFYLNALVTPIRLATEEEKEKLFKEIEKNGYRWNFHARRLEKLIKPKFNVGDKIKYKNGKNKDGIEMGIILSITDNTYDTSYDVAISDDKGIFIPITEQDDWELVPNKFDTNTLEPFDKVLGRSTTDGIWRCDFLFNIKENGIYKYECIAYCYKYCIPYKGNEHLRGTTDDCNEYYKIWED